MPTFIYRNATKRWKQATTGLEQVKEKETLSVVIKATNFNVDMQKQAVEIANIALDSCGLENEIATYVKTHMDELTGENNGKFKGTSARYYPLLAVT